MSQVLLRVSIPPRLRSETLLKTGSALGFDVPNTLAGVRFMSFWKSASAETRDAMMMRAYNEDIPIIDTLPAPEGNDD